MLLTLMSDLWIVDANPSINRIPPFLDEARYWQGWRVERQLVFVISMPSSMIHRLHSVLTVVHQFSIIPHVIICLHHAVFSRPCLIFILVYRLASHSAVHSPLLSGQLVGSLGNVKNKQTMATQMSRLVSWGDVSWPTIHSTANFNEDEHERLFSAVICAAIVPWIVSLLTS